MVNHKEDVQQQPTGALPFQTVGKLGGGKEKQLCKGSRGWMPCCEGSRVVLVLQSKKGRVWD